MKLSDIGTTNHIDNETFGTSAMADTPDARRRSLLALTALLSVSGVARAAQAFPNKPITMVIPYPPGSGNDIVGRVLSARLAQELGGGRLVVENRAGASGVIATDYTRRAAADGYTLLLTSISLSINPFTMNTNYKVSDFTPIGMVAKVPFTLIVNKSVPANNLKELADYIKADPNRLSAGTGGPTGTTWFLLQAFKKAAGVQIVSASYKGTPDALLDLEADRVQMMFAPISTAMIYNKSGHVKILGVTGTERTSLLPDLPTFTEQGFPTLDITTWFGLVGPAGIPADVVTTLSDALGKSLQSRDVIDPLLKQGFVPSFERPAKFGAFMRDDMALWSRLVKEAGIKRPAP